MVLTGLVQNITRNIEPVMAIQGIMFRACSLVGHGYKSPLCSRFLTSFYHQTASVRSVESKLGLPEKPKRPMSAFFRFAQSIRPKMMSQYPGLPATEISKKISEEWKTCDPAIKLRMTEESHQSAKEYGVALQKYHLSLSKEDFEAIREAKSKVKEAKEARAHRKKLKKLNKPKRPLNAYMLFIEQEIAKGTLKNMPADQRFKKGAEMWRNAPKDVVAKFSEKAAAARQQYKIDLDAWEETMVASGHLDVLHESHSKTKKKA